MMSVSQSINLINFKVSMFLNDKFILEYSRKIPCFGHQKLLFFWGRKTNNNNNINNNNSFSEFKKKFFYK
jgi:hypothetical protein